MWRTWYIVSVVLSLINLILGVMWYVEFRYYITTVAISLIVVICLKVYYRYREWLEEEEKIRRERIPLVKIKFKNFLEYYTLFRSSFLFSSLNCTDNKKRIDKIFYAKHGWKITEDMEGYNPVNQYSIIKSVYRYHYPFSTTDSVLNDKNDSVYRIAFSFLDYIRYETWRNRIIFVISTAEKRKERAERIAEKILYKNKIKKQDQEAMITMHQALLEQVELEIAASKKEVEDGISGTVEVLSQMQAV